MSIFGICNYSHDNKNSDKNVGTLQKLRLLLRSKIIIITDTQWLGYIIMYL